MSARRRPRLGWLSLHSVRTRLVVGSTLALALALVAMGAVTQHLVRAFMLVSVDRDLERKALRLAEQPFPRPEEGRPGQLPRSSAPGPGAEGRDRPLIIDLQGRIVRPADATTAWDASAVRPAIQGRRILRTVTLNGNPYRVLTRPFPPDSPPLGVVQAPYSLAEVDLAVGSLHRALLALVPLALLAAALGGFALTSRALAPVRRIATVAERIDADCLSERLPVAGRDEFWQLAGVINGMLDRLQEQVERERRFTSDASHELRTPIAVIKANTTLCLSSTPTVDHYRRSMEAIDKASDGMSRLVQDLLLLARADAGRLGRRTVLLPVADLLREAARIASRNGGPAITVDPVEPDLCLPGDEDQLLRLLTNLLDNAVRHTPPSGSVRLKAERTGAEIALTVADNGVGIAPEHLPHLGERFYRVDAARSRPEGGAGLGLAIARQIVAAHDGRMAIESRPGQGTSVRVTLPAQDAA